MGTTRRLTAAALAVVFLWAGTAAAQTKALMYKDPWCGCCHEYVAYLEQQGLKVSVKTVEDMTPVKRMLRVPDQMASCHTMVVGDYIVEGHVPLAAIDRLLAERPDIVGIALPGMPLGSPGMNGDKEGPFKIYALTEAGPKLFMVD